MAENKFEGQTVQFINARTGYIKTTPVRKGKAWMNNEQVPVTEENGKPILVLPDVLLTDNGAPPAGACVLGDMRLEQKNKIWRCVGRLKSDAAEGSARRASKPSTKKVAPKEAAAK